jgi:hypothetical protein
LGGSLDPGQGIDTARVPPRSARDRLYFVGAEHDLDGRKRRGSDERAEALATVASSGEGDWSASVPEPVVDALVETAWAFPGIRVSCARLLRPHRFEFSASAGANDLNALAGRTLEIDAAPRLFRPLVRGETVGIEDVDHDSRVGATAPKFRELGVAAVMLMPVKSPSVDGLLGLLVFDAPRPRTWSTKETSALERLVPLVQLALENTALTAALERTRAAVIELERRWGAMRGIIDAALHDGRVLLDALAAASRATPSQQRDDTIAALERQIYDLMAEVAALPNSGGRRDREAIDLNEFIVSAAPVLRAILGTGHRLLVRTDPLPVWTQGHRPGLDRLLKTLVTHGTAAGSGRDVVLRTYGTSSGVCIEIGGDGIGTDDRLLSLVTEQPELAVDSLGIDLWQARCEALLHDGRIGYQAGPDGTKILITLRTSGSR